MLLLKKLNLDPLQLRSRYNKVSMLYKIACGLTNAKPREGALTSTQKPERGLLSPPKTQRLGLLSPPKTHRGASYLHPKPKQWPRVQSPHPLIHNSNSQEQLLPLTSMSVEWHPTPCPSCWLPPDLQIHHWGLVEGCPDKLKHVASFYPSFKHSSCKCNHMLFKISLRTTYWGMLP